MSKIGKMPIELPKGVEVTVDGDMVKVKGAKGELSRQIPKYLDIEIADEEVKIKTQRKSADAMAMYGTIRSHIANMVKGVSDGWEKSLELIGTGYRAQISGNKLTLVVGYSHPIDIEAPEGIDFKVEKNVVTVSGVDKDVVGFISAKIREVRPPEPYKGKGIKYQNEEIIRKPGKAAKAAGA